MAQPSNVLNLDITRNEIIELKEIGTKWISLVPELYQQNENSSIVTFKSGETSNYSSIHSLLMKTQSIGLIMHLYLIS